MIQKLLFCLAFVVALSVSQATAQSCDQGNCGGYGNYGRGGGCLQSFGIGGLYSQNCGRAISTQDAAGLWSNYCNDDCSFNGGCGCGLFRGGLVRKFFGGGCGGGSGCGTGYSNGCDSGGYVGGCGTNGGFVSSGCGVDAGCGTGVGHGISSGGSCGCGLFRGLFGRLGFGGGGCCGCYQGCFGYPGGPCGGGCGSGGFGFSSAGSCGGGCGCGLVGRTVGAVSGIKSHFCCSIRGLKSRLFGGGLFSGCLGRAGCYGYNGGYFFDAPITSSQNFGFYSAGCGCDSSGGCTSGGSHGYTGGNINSFGNGCTSSAPPQAQPMQSGADCQPTPAFNQNPGAPLQAPAIDSGNSLSPGGEVISGEVVNEANGG